MRGARLSPDSLAAGEREIRSPSGGSRGGPERDRLRHVEASQPAVETRIAGWADKAAYPIAEASELPRRKDRAFEGFECSHADRDPGIAYAAMDPRFDPPRDDPRWTAFLRKLGLA
ncbi:MAG: hypothetical protein ABI585_07375 [Betaproteobacteria bacterium]